MIIIKLINLIHFIIVFLISISIFIPSQKFKKYILIILLFILFHLMTNHGKCGLTELEYYITGKPYELGFIYRILSPFMNVDKKYFKNKLYLLHLLYIIILIYQLLDYN